MIERDIAPLGRLVALRTVRPELTVMFILGRMTGITILGRAFEYSVLMAGKTGNGGV